MISVIILRIKVSENYQKIDYEIFYTLFWHFDVKYKIFFFFINYSFFDNFNFYMQNN